MIAAEIEPGSTGAVGKHIVQVRSDATLSSQERAKEILNYYCTAMTAVLHAIHDQLDLVIAKTAAFQVALLQTKLTECTLQAGPNSRTIMAVGDWFITHIPALMPTFYGLCTDPALTQLIQVADDTFVQRLQQLQLHAQ